MSAGEDTSIESRGLSSRAPNAPDAPPPGYSTWRDYLVQLLRVASSIEHALMVQYLYAAYSLDPETGKDRDERLMIANWQNLIVSVAKEEMGHLLTVQNVLCLLGAPIDLAREHRSFDADYLPFSFRLERLTMDSLTRYTCAEMPDEVPAATSPYLKLYEALTAYRASIPKDSGAPHVGDLYRDIIEIVADSSRIPDSDFHHESYRFQACWDDWGRGYNTKTATHDGVNIATTFKLFAQQEKEPRRADVIIERVATRTQAKDALTRIFEQGEAAPTEFAGSHFQRFHAIRMNFVRVKKKNGADWEPTHPVADDPHTLLPTDMHNASASTITWPPSEKLADLFNLRYRMLLTYLSHSFHLAGDGIDARLNGAVVHKAFAEMYNLKAIAGLLVRLPLKDPKHRSRAGPPFATPGTLALPRDAIDRWRLHGDLIDQALKLNGDLQELDDGLVPHDAQSYLRILRELDRGSADWIGQLVAGLSRNQVLSP